MSGCGLVVACDGILLCLLVRKLTHLCVCVIVESGGLKKEEAWFVESVTVSNEAGVKWACSYRQWLSLYHTDCQVSMYKLMK